MHIVAAIHKVFKHILFAAWHEFLRGSAKSQSCCMLPLAHHALGFSRALKRLLSLPKSLRFVGACCMVESMFANSAADPLSKACLHNFVTGL
jgi:hypothetical protein